MDAGKLRHRIELQSLETTKDTFGADTATGQVWTTYATVWAEVKPLTGTERYGAQQVQASMSHQIRLRWREGVLATHRARWRRKGADRTFDILAPINVDERDRELVLLCAEATA